MTGKRIVLIGAGSMVFTDGLLRDVMLSPHLSGSTIALMDLNNERLDLMHRLAKRMVTQQGVDIHLEATTDRREALRGADYVVTTISVGGQEAWEKDLSIPLQYDVVQSVGDSVGPGGVSRALRHIPVIVDVARDMEELCPDAILFNYTNPMSAITRAVNRETSIFCVGLCHGVTNTRIYLSEYMEVPFDDLEVRVAGINHLVWMTQLLYKGNDAYPELRRLLDEKGPQDRPAAFELMDIYGYFPGPGHDHIVEFYPHFLSARSKHGEPYGVGLFPLEELNKGRDEHLELYKAQAEGSEPIAVKHSGEDVMDIITAQITNQPKICAVNVPNYGAVAGLPEEAVVEVSALVDGGGIQPLRNDALPAGILGTLRQRIDQQELTVDAAVSGDARLVLQAILADPLVHSVADAKAMTEEFLETHAAYLPTFK